MGGELLFEGGVLVGAVRVAAQVVAEEEGELPGEGAGVADVDVGPSLTRRLAEVALVSLGFWEWQT